MQVDAHVKRNRARPWTPLVLVAATFAGGCSGEAAPRDDIAGPVEPLEAEPLVPHGRIAEASWDSEDGAEDAALAGAGAEDRWKDFAGDRRKRYDASVEEVLEPLGGLAAYVAPVEEEAPAR